MAAESPALDHQPFEAAYAPLAIKGLHLGKALSLLDPAECSRLTNAIPRPGGGLLTRAGLTALIHAGTNVHSAYYFGTPVAATFSRFWGIDTHVYRGNTGVPTDIEGGYSGNPLSFVSAKPSAAQESWLYIGDTSRNRKITRTGAVTKPIGLPAPASITTALHTVLTKTIANFLASDGTQAAAWTLTIGSVTSNAEGLPDAPTAADVTGGVAFSTHEGTVASDGYTSVLGIARALDLSTFGSGIDATDADFLHFKIQTANRFFNKIRVYLVVSAAFNPAIVPGQNNVDNTDAYYYEFIPSSSVYVTEWGVNDNPLARGDFTRLGSTAGRDWSTVTGIIIELELPFLTEDTATFSELYLAGGYGPDNLDLAAQPFDYRLTNYDPTTDVEGNPTEVQPASAFLTDVHRQAIDITGPVSGIANVVQRAYRRGGTNNDNWYFVGQSTADGGTIIDTSTDAEAILEDTVQIDNDQPITTVDATGATLHAQTLRTFLAPVDDIMFGLGDAYRPGELYWSKPGKYDAWPPQNHLPICPPDEEGMNGVPYGGQLFVFSRKRGYSVQVNSGSVSVLPTDCTDGLAGYWALCPWPRGIAFVALDGIRSTTGGASEYISEAIRDLFHNKAVNGYQPVDMAQASSLRLGYVNSELWFQYLAIGGTYQTLMYSLLYDYWRAATFTPGVNLMASEPTTAGREQVVVLGSPTGGKAYQHTGQDDDGVAIACNYRSGAYDFGRADEKLFGQYLVEGDLQGATLTGTAYLDGETVALAADVLIGSVGNAKYLATPFGTTPRHGRNLSIDLAWLGSNAVMPSIDKLGVSFVIQPEQTKTRATTWEALGDSDGYLKGLWIDCDTQGVDLTFLVERLLDGVQSTVATLTVNSNATRRQWFSWAAVHADLVRIRPTVVTQPWMLYGCKWDFDPLPPRAIVWDTGPIEVDDAYLIGVDVVCDTFGLDKTLEVTLDGTIIGTFTANANGKRQLTFSFDLATPKRGQVLRLYATDGAHVGLLYDVRWLKEKEPDYLTNLNGIFSSAGSTTDKWWKGVILELDTFNQSKTLAIEIDGVVDHTESVTANGRQIVNIAWPQIKGRIFRVYATDSHPARRYSEPVFLFDEEPFALTRYETQELTLGTPGWKILLTVQEISLRSTADVTLQIVITGQSGQVIATDSYTLAATGGAKQNILVPVNGRKGYFFKFVFTSTNPFSLYREESTISFQPFGGGEVQTERPFGDDDLDLVRGMRNPSLVAERRGGGNYQ